MRDQDESVLSWSAETESAVWVLTAAKLRHTHTHLQLLSGLNQSRTIRLSRTGLQDIMWKMLQIYRARCGQNGIMMHSRTTCKLYNQCWNKTKMWQHDGRWSWFIFMITSEKWLAPCSNSTIVHTLYFKWIFYKTILMKPMRLFKHKNIIK